MIRFILSVMFSLLLIHSGFAQCNLELVNEFQRQLSRSENLTDFPYGSTAQSSVKQLLPNFINDLDRKGILYKDRKISQSIICSQLVDIKFLLDKIDVLTQELKSQCLKYPKNDEMNSSIGSIKNQKMRFWEMRENLDSVKTIKGLTSFLNMNQYLSDILEQSFQLKQKQVEFLASYLMEKQKLDSAQFKFTLDYIPLQIETQQLQSKLALELNSLATKLKLYQSKKYNYIKFL